MFKEVGKEIMNEYIEPSRYKAILKLYVDLLNENKDLKEKIKELKECQKKKS